ncbi:unnamed protein product [Paramecium pentaurelia]|uniref:Uncharacterized protein n=1 Tax=Paramecium pentaurelia TaxID=43138 RepID=A0A8S1YQ39_9CILI|nr:unnamed protein product [Paramecium pentaurelia]
MDLLLLLKVYLHQMIKQEQSNCNYLDLDGSTKSQPIIVYSISNLFNLIQFITLYPHHPQLISQPQGYFIASWIESSLASQNLSDDVYMKRFKSEGTQLSLNTIICPNNCLTCSTSNVCQSCKQNCIILSNQCYPKINNCETHVIENQILSCNLCINGFDLIKNSCYQMYFPTNYQQYNLQLINHILIYLKYKLFQMVIYYIFGQERITQ